MNIIQLTHLDIRVTQFGNRLAALKEQAEGKKFKSPTPLQVMKRDYGYKETTAKKLYTAAEADYALLQIGGQNGTKEEKKRYLQLVKVFNKTFPETKN